ncbi:MAG TPA: hypothetical protein VHS32_13240, partial [Streptosporangiaceae bacterium]|nr:hypothetical protein [Streptosporangiaceae bacterium]
MRLISPCATDMNQVLTAAGSHPSAIDATAAVTEPATTPTWCWCWTDSRSEAVRWFPAAGDLRARGPGRAGGPPLAGGPGWASGDDIRASLGHQLL